MVTRYEKEQYIHEQVPIKVYTHRLFREMIYTVQHWHNSIEINIATRGSLTYTVDGQRRELPEGGVILINSGLLHSAARVGNLEVFEGVTVLISRPFLDSWLGENTRLEIPEDPDVIRQIVRAVKQLGEIDCSSEPNKKLLEMEQLFRLMVVFSQHCVRDTGSQREFSDRSVERIKRVVNYLNVHYKEDISLNQVAEVFACTPQYLSRTFKEHIGTPFYKYLQHIRLMNTLNQIKDEKDTPLLECALENGFLNNKSFIATFKEYYNCTPSQWRKNNP